MQILWQFSMLPVPELSNRPLTNGTDWSGIRTFLSDK